MFLKFNHILFEKEESDRSTKFLELTLLVSGVCTLMSTSHELVNKRGFSWKGSCVV